MYETYNRRTKVKLDFGFDIKKCFIADLSENKQKELKLTNGSVNIEVKPFEIVTIFAE